MKFGIREAVDVVFKTTKAITDNSLLGQNWGAGEPVLYFDTLKMSTTEGTATTVYAQGGAGNPRLIAWEGDKTITFTFEDALISPEGMAILTGAGMIEASATDTIQVHKKSVVVATFTDGTPDTLVADISDDVGVGETLVATDIYGFVVDAYGYITERLGAAASAATAETVTFNLAAGSAVTANASVLVDYYVTRESGVKELTIEANKFAGYFYIEGETLFREQSTGADLPAMIVVPNAKIQTAFTFSMSPTGDPSTFTFTADAFPGVVKGSPNTGKVMYAIQLFED